MTNSTAGGGAGCQQSKVSIIYHLLKDTTFCRHAEICGKRILIPPACGLAEAASALPSAGAGLGAGASQYDSQYAGIRHCRNGSSRPGALPACAGSPLIAGAENRAANPLGGWGRDGGCAAGTP